MFGNGEMSLNEAENQFLSRKDGVNDEILEKIKTLLFGKEKRSYQKLVTLVIRQKKLSLRQLLSSYLIRIAFSLNIIDIWAAQINAIVNAEKFETENIGELLEVLIQPAMRFIFRNESDNNFRIIIDKLKDDSQAGISYVTKKFIFNPATKQLFIDLNEKEFYADFCFKWYKSKCGRGNNIGAVEFAQAVSSLIDDLPDSETYRNEVESIFNRIIDFKGSEKPFFSNLLKLSYRAKELIDPSHQPVQVSSTSSNKPALTKQEKVEIEARFVAEFNHMVRQLFSYGFISNDYAKSLPDCYNNFDRLIAKFLELKALYQYHISPFMHRPQLSSTAQSTQMLGGNSNVMKRTASMVQNDGVSTGAHNTSHDFFKRPRVGATSVAQNFPAPAQNSSYGAQSAFFGAPSQPGLSGHMSVVYMSATPALPPYFYNAKGSHVGAPHQPVVQGYGMPGYFNATTEQYPAIAQQQCFFRQASSNPSGAAQPTTQQLQWLYQQYGYK